VIEIFAAILAFILVALFVKIFGKEPDDE